MKPASPVWPGNPHNLPETVYAKDQPEYQPLPAVNIEAGVLRFVLTRWRVESFRDWLRLVLFGSVYVQQLQIKLDDRFPPLTPIKVSTEPPKDDAE
jgi:hypothetical protein